jgi:hypothetical protein
VYLVLDGLDGAEKCKNKIFPKYSNAYALKKFSQINLPSCLFNMQRLKTLHIAGNGISGTLPENIAIDSKLNDLALSHNALYGSIPINFQKKKWKNLDLSFNGLNGGLKFFLWLNESSTSTLSLQVNKLSGTLPSTLFNAKSIRVLKSNLFSCDVLSKNLPKYDPDKNIYQCGSNPFLVAG